MKNIDLDKLIHWRREIHKFPESGWTEFVTTGLVITELRKMGIEVKAGPEIINRDFILGRNEEQVKQAIVQAEQRGTSRELLDEMQELTGCLATIDTGKPGPTFAFRFDIDCVNVQESLSADHLPNKEGFASCRAGLMHSCAHDGHTAIGLGVASWLMNNKDKLSGRYKLIFQPAEEGVRGARPIAESGILDDVDYFMALHLGTVIGTGELIVDPSGFLCTKKIDFRFFGEAAHAGLEPQKGRNALVGACYAAVQMMGAPRHGDGMSQVNVGTIHAGEGRNVIPASGVLQVEVRGKTQKISDYLADYVIRCAEGAALTHQLRLETEIAGEAVDLINDQQIVTALQNVIARHPTLKSITRDIGGGSDDATVMVRRVQDHGGKACYFLVGADLAEGHHKSGFDFDEKSLETGVLMVTEGIVELLKQHAN